MVPRKTWVSENFGQILKARKRFLCVSKSRFLMIFASRSLESFYRGVSKSQICRLSFPFGLKESNFSEFMGTLIELSKQIIKTVFHWHFGSFSLVLFVPLSRNFRRLAFQARIFRSKVSLSQCCEVSNLPFYTPKQKLLADFVLINAVYTVIWHFFCFRHAKLTAGGEERVRILAIECVSFLIFSPSYRFSICSRSNAHTHTNKEGAKTRGKAERTQRAVRFTRFLDYRFYV